MDLLFRGPAQNGIKLILAKGKQGLELEPSQQITIGWDGLADQVIRVRCQAGKASFGRACPFKDHCPIARKLRSQFLKHSCQYLRGGVGAASGFDEAGENIGRRSLGVSSGLMTSATISMLRRPAVQKSSDSWRIATMGDRNVARQAGGKQAAVARQLRRALNPHRAMHPSDAVA